METNLSGILLLSALLIIVLLGPFALISSNTQTGSAIRTSAEHVGERARTLLSDLPDTDVISNGKRITMNITNAGLTSLSDFFHMDVIIEYKSNETGEMIYRRLKYASSTKEIHYQPITLDSVSTHSTTSEDNTLNFKHTIGHHHNRILIVGTQGKDSSKTDCNVGNVTYNGRSLKRVDEATAGTTSFICVGIWYLLSPDTGTHDVVITWKGKVSDKHGSATSIYNAAQIKPELRSSKTSNSDTTIYMFYGNTNIMTSLENVAETWDSNYKAVLHLQEYGSGNDYEFVDSSGNGNHGTGGGPAGSGLSTSTPIQTTGKFGYAQAFTSTTNDNITLKNISDQDWTALTVQCWINPNTQKAESIFSKQFGTSTSDAVWSMGKDTDVQIIQNTNLGSMIHNGGNNFTTSTWTHLAYSWDANLSGAIHSYQNGVLTMTDSVPGSTLSPSETLPIIGNASNFTKGFNGFIQECRLSNVARSANWLMTEYNNQSNPSQFFELGEEQALSGDYYYHRAISISGSDVSGNESLENFPLFLSGTFPFLATASNNGRISQNDGFDIAFYNDDDGITQINHEIMDYRPTDGYISLWVQIPELYGADSTPYSTINLSTTTDGTWLIDAIGSGTRDSEFAPSGPNQLKIYSTRGSESSFAGSIKLVDSVSSQDMSWTQNSNMLAHVSVAFSPAAQLSSVNPPSSSIRNNLPGSTWTDLYRTFETYNHGSWDPGEIQTVRIVLEPRQESGTNGRVTVSTPNGVTVTELFSRPHWQKLSSTPYMEHYYGGLASSGSNLYSIRGATTTRFAQYDHMDEANLVNNSWIPLANTPESVGTGGTLVYASDNGISYIYALRGGNTDKFWRYDIDADTWMEMEPALSTVGSGGALAWNESNYIYGLRGNSTNDFWQYSMTSNTWIPLADIPVSVGDGGALTYGSGYLYAFGGGNTNFWRYNSDSWTALANTPNMVGEGASLTWTGNDHIFAWPGGNSNHFWRYDITNDSWITLHSTPTQVGKGGDLVSHNSEIYAIRGGSSDDIWTYQPVEY